MVGHGVDPADAARLRRAQRPRHRRPARRHARRRTCAGWCWPARWSSTARAATTAPSTASCGPGRAGGPTSTRDGSSHLPPLRPRPGPRARRRGHAVRPAQHLRRHEAAPRSTWSAAWARQTGGTAWSLRYHNVYGPRMPRDTPYAGVASIFRSALERGEAPRVLEDGGQRRDFVHVTDVAAANVLALTTDPPADGLTAVNVCSGEPHTIGDLAGALAAATAGPEPVVVGGARPGDVRHVVADPARARSLLGFRARGGLRGRCAGLRHRPAARSGPDGRRHRTVSGRGPSAGPSRPEDRGVNMVPRDRFFPAWTRPTRCRS